MGKNSDLGSGSATLRQCRGSGSGFDPESSYDGLPKNEILPFRQCSFIVTIKFLKTFIKNHLLKLVPKAIFM
jgi:hypothetical protein